MADWEGSKNKCNVHTSANFLSNGNTKFSSSNQFSAVICFAEQNDNPALKKYELTSILQLLILSPQILL